MGAAYKRLDFGDILYCPLTAKIVGNAQDLFSVGYSLSVTDYGCDIIIIMSLHPWIVTQFTGYTITLTGI